MTRVRRQAEAARLRPARWAITVAVGLLLASAAWTLVRALTPTDGAPVSIDYGFGEGLTVEPLPGDRALLLPGDVVIAVEGVPIDQALSESGVSNPGLRPGAEWRYRVLRDGDTLDVLVRLRDGGLVLDRLRADAPSITIGMAVLILGAYTVFRRPEHGAARALLLFGAGLTAYNVVGWLSIDVAHVVAAPWLFILGIEATTALLSVWVTAAALLALSFPTPPMALERRPWLTKAVFAVLLAATVGVQTVYLASGRATLEGLDGLYGLNEACLYGLSGLALAGVIRTIVRSRRDPSTRRQGALVALGMGTTVALLVSANLFLGQEWPAWFEVVAWLPLPTALAVALVRGEFLDIRATVNRALVFASLTTILLALYVAAVAAIGGVVGRSGLAQTLPATGLVAVAFAPVRARVQRAVERLLYGERGDPSRVLGALGRRLETAVPPDHLLPAIAETVANALRLPYVGIKTTSGEAARLACERGERPEHPESLPLVHQGRSVGELLVGLRRGERSLSDSDRSLLGAIAPQVASAVNATGLLTEIAASRSRLAVAREEERARLRHDLHDRLGPHLVGLGLQLDTLEGRVQDSDVVDVIRKAHNEAESALNEVRRISRGLRPAELDELGLVAAIDAAAARLTVGDDDHAWRASVAAAVQLPAIPAATEAAAYHIAVEALTNAHRHSGGGHAEVHIGVDASGASLTVEISDDGRGMNGKAGEGVGIRSMTERAAGVGGALELCDRPAGGTVVRADLPLSR